MPSIDLKVFGRRTREINRIVRRSSPAFVYSGPLGIVLIAALRSGTSWRVGKVMDRMAIVSRGDALAGTMVHKIAANEAYTIATSFSNGGVLGREPAEAVANTLRERNSHFTLTTPLPIEACFVQLGKVPDDDYLAYIGVDGALQTFRRVWFLGEAAGHHEASSQSEISQSRRNEDQDALNNLLATALGHYNRLGDLREALMMPTTPEPARNLIQNSSLDVVVLDREALRKRDYRKVFNRLTS
jgi:hypothetical protein